jgi:argininosuccinate lyase
VLVAHFFLAHVAPLRRDYERFAVARSEADALPLGSGAVAGTSYAVDVEAIARDLGFSRIVANSIDASSDRDFAATFLYACTTTMVHLSRMAEDFIILTGDEPHFFELSDALSTGSSMMPQKKNPDPLELVRGKSGRAIGLLSGWLATMKGLPLGYNKDLQEDKATAFEAEDLVFGCVSVTTTVVRTLAIHEDAARTAASGLLMATDVADYLVRRGIAFRAAHEITGRIVRDLYAAGRDFSSLSAADWRRYNDQFGDDVMQAITPEAAVAAKRTPQSTNPTAVAAALAETRQWLASQDRPS